MAKVATRYAILICLLVLAVSTTASADECASYGPRASLSTPLDGARVARNVRFSVGLYESCGGVAGGPHHSFRLVDAAGAVIAADARSRPHPDCTPPTCERIDIVPRSALRPGELWLQLRRPVDTASLSDWTALGRFMVVDHDDTSPPRFAGIAQAHARKVEGTAFLSPCQAIDAWELETSFELELADDGPTGHDELLYALERQPVSGGRWQLVMGFRPNKLDGQRGGVSFRSEDWASAWRYRVVVRDAAGNSTTGGRTAVVSAPQEPAEPLTDSSELFPMRQLGGAPRSCGSCALGADDRLAPWFWWTLVALLACRRAPRACARQVTSTSQPQV